MAINKKERNDLTAAAAGGAAGHILLFVGEIAIEIGSKCKNTKEAFSNGALYGGILGAFVGLVDGCVYGGLIGGLFAGGTGSIIGSILSGFAGGLAGAVIGVAAGVVLGLASGVVIGATLAVATYGIIKGVSYVWDRCTGKSREQQYDNTVNNYGTPESSYTNVGKAQFPEQTLSQPTLSQPTMNGLGQSQPSVPPPPYDYTPSAPPLGSCPQ